MHSITQKINSLLITFEIYIYVDHIYIMTHCSWFVSYGWLDRIHCAFLRKLLRFAFSTLALILEVKILH